VIKRISLLIAVALMAVMMLAATAGVGYAKITPAQPASCENNSGQKPGGQQPNCKGEGLTQNEATCAENPTGKCPKGQN
jgi:hypothetical protein